MKCDCGNKLNIHNKDGICNECITENKFVKIRFVKGGAIHDCWSDNEYLKCLEFLKDHNQDSTIFTYKARASRVVNIVRLISAHNQGESIDIDDLVRDFLRVFLIDVMGVINEDDTDRISCSKAVEEADVWKWETPNNS